LVDAAQLLAARTPLQLEGPYLNLRPDVHGTDGFFAAVFERRKAGAEVAPDAKGATEVKVAIDAQAAFEADLIEVAEGVQVESSPKKAVKGKPRKKAENDTAPAPASAIDAFAAFLAKDAQNDHPDDAEPEDDQSAKPAKKPRASKTAGKSKKA
jgi:16S rRNA (cytosine967-C5)-methyltransferase